jgi:hypothetical protein
LSASLEISSLARTSRLLKFAIGRTFIGFLKSDW